MGKGIIAPGTEIWQEEYLPAICSFGGLFCA